MTMILIEQTQVPDTALPVAEFRDHLQLGSGFSDDGFQDAVLRQQLRAAIALVEKETGKALIRRDFLYVLSAWREMAHQVLPVAPVTVIHSLAITNLAETVETISPERYRLIEDAHRPQLKWLGWVLPTIPVGGKAEILFEAGFAAEWSGVPAGLGQAVFLVAARFYEDRSAEAGGALPGEVTSLLKPYQPVRLFGGGRR